MRALSDHISVRHKADILIMSLFITPVTDISLAWTTRGNAEHKEAILLMLPVVYCSCFGESLVMLDWCLAQ